jgi:hypothetical protein
VLLRTAPDRQGERDCGGLILASFAMTLSYIAPMTRGADALSTPVSSLPLRVPENDEGSVRYRALLEGPRGDRVIVNQAGEIIPLNLQVEKHSGCRRDELRVQKMVNGIRRVSRKCPSASSCP